MNDDRKTKKELIKELRILRKKIKLYETEPPEECIVEEENQLSDHVYRTAIEKAFGVPYRLDFLSGTYEYLGDGIEYLVGVPKKEFARETLCNMVKETVIVDRDQPREFDEYKELFHDAQVPDYQADLRIITPAGQEKWVNDSAIPIQNKNGEVIGSLGILQDITKRKVVEEELFRSNARYKAILNASEDYIFVMDKDFCFVQVNDASERRFGRPSSKKIGETIRDIVTDDEAKCEFYEEKLKEVFRTGRTLKYEDSAVIAGRILHSETLLSPIFGQDGQVEFVGGISRDITERKESETLLRDSEMTYRSAIAAAQGVPYRRNLDRGDFTFIGEGIKRLTGYSPEEFTTDLFNDIVIESQLRGELERIDFEYACTLAREGKVNRWQADCFIETKSGEKRWLADYSVHIKNKDGQVSESLGILYDITDRAQWANRLKESEKRERQFSRMLTSLTEVNNNLSMVEDINEFCRMAVQLGKERLGFERVGLWIIDEATQKITGSFGIDEEGNVRDERGKEMVMEEGSSLEQLMKSESNVLINKNQPLFNDNGQVVGYGTLAAASLWDGERIVGSICVDDFFSQGGISDNLGELLALYASSLGHLYSLKRTEEEVSGHNRRLSILTDVATAITGTIKPSELCDKLVRVLRKYLPCDAFFVNNYLRISGKTDYLRYYDTIDGEFQIVPVVSQPYKPHGASRQALDNMETVLILREEIPETDENFVTFGTQKRSASLLYVPMIVGDQAIGLISIQSYQFNAYGTWETNLLVSIAQEFAPALEAAILAQKILDREKLERLFGRKLAALVETTNVLAMETSENDLCRRAIELGRSRLGFDRLGIFLNNNDKTIQGTFGTDEQGNIRDERELLFESSENNYFSSAIEKEIQLSRRDEAPLYNHKGDVVGYGTHVVSCFSDGEKNIGGVSMDNLLSRTPVSEQQCELLRLFASAIGTLLSRRRTEEERRKLESQIQHTQKLESLGILAGGIAHDFNNLLMGVLGNAGMALLEMPPESPARYSVEQIETAAQRAADLTKQMLAYSGKGRFIVNKVNLSSLVEEMSHLLESSVSRKALLKLNVHKDISPVEGDATQLRQIIMNLLLNASDSLGDQNGVVSLTTGVRHCTRLELTETYVDDELPAGEYIFLQVSDTGSGMDRETRQRIFDPFFTTKFQGRGLGLAAVLGIVRGHRGAIKVESKPGHGTTFTVLLPKVECKSEKKKIASQESNRPLEDFRGQGTILVVDDEVTVRKLAERILEKFGFRTILASDGQKALDIYKTRSKEIDLILLDLTMPNLDGEQTYQRMIKIKPDTLILLSSGFDEQDAIKKFSRKNLAGFIQKPYRPQMLLMKIKEILG